MVKLNGDIYTRNGATKVNITVGEKFDEKKFFGIYELIMKNIDNMHGEIITLDMSECRWVENVIIPDILVLGEIVRSNYGKILSLFLPRHGKDIHRIKSYLNDIKFIQIAEWEKNIDVKYITYSEEEEIERILPDYCITRMYKIDVEGLSDEEKKRKEKIITEQIGNDILNKYMELFQKYLSQFFYIKKTDTEDLVFNTIQTFIIQISINAIVHGHRKAFVTMQANVKDNICTVSIADNGDGITEGIREKYKKGIKMSLTARDTFERYNSFHQDILASIEAIAYRYDDKIYGLYNVFLQVMDEEGEVHIHTNNVLLLFKQDCKAFIKNVQSKNEFAISLYNYLKQEKQNVIKTECFQGTHMKLLIPIR